MGIETLAAISIASSVGGGILGAFGANTKADAEQSMYNYKSQVAKNNSIIAERNATEAVAAGEIAGQTNDMRTRAKVGDALVAQAANGLDVGSGTNVNVRDSIQSLGHLDTLTILHNALKQSTGFKSQAMNFTAESALDTAAGQNSRTAGDYNVATSLLGGATSVSDKWMKFNRAGIF